MWTTMLLKGVVIMFMGFPGQSLDQCQTLQTMILADVQQSYITNPEKFVTQDGKTFDPKDVEVLCLKDMPRLGDIHETF